MIERWSDRLVLVQAANAEWAQGRHLPAGATLLDLQKAFEHIRLGELLRAAQRTGLPLAIAPICPAKSSEGLRSCWATPAPTHTEKAVLTGCHLATVMLQLVMYTHFGAIQAFPLRTAEEVQIWGLVDDSGLHKVGPSELVCLVVHDATIMLHGKLEEMDQLA